ncbi:MAG: bifunctional pyr operon transcriptional regulator/uracil phosphoribosyltransferase PyrR [Deltaproteobacteria bacterium]|nr:bifunctional pyr operon transcriptional regulator/uracil phosphoribosyltransferase PyrR [Deltaproteobacteria bacterium]
MKRSELKKARRLSAQEIKKCLEQFCREMLRQYHGTENLAFIGIRTRGFYLAKRLCDMLRKSGEREIPLGELDITLYRDDLNTLLPTGRVDHTRIPFDINNKTIILVDDVLNTGRTVRAAVDHLIDLGRPRLIHLAVLIDRGGREFPIAANFVGKRINLPAKGDVQVKLKEVDKVDEVVIKD